MAETGSQKLIWPGLAALYEKLAPCGYGLMRFAAGAVVVYTSSRRSAFRRRWPGPIGLAFSNWSVALSSQLVC